MPVFRITKESIVQLPETTFAAKGIRERADLQRLLKPNIAVVAPDVLIICDEFEEWEDSRRRIDLLGIDRSGSLVVIELKRDDEGGHMELQAIRYAAMVSRMTFQRAIKTYQAYLNKNGESADARSTILKFLRVSEPPQDNAKVDVRIVLVSADFAKEMTTAVLWLREWELDIRCVKVKPYADGDGTILEVQQVVPLPEATEYQVSIREEAISRRESARETGEPTGYYFMNTGDGSGEGRSWEDCFDYGFMMAGGGKEWQDQVRSLKIGDRVCAYLSGHGYVGIGEVVAEAVPQRDFVPKGQSRRLIDLPMKGSLQRERLSRADECDWCVAVDWLYKVPREMAVLKSRFRRPTFQAIKQEALVDELIAAFKATKVAK